MEGKTVAITGTTSGTGFFTLAMNDRLGPTSKIIATVAEPGFCGHKFANYFGARWWYGLDVSPYFRFAQSAEDGSMPILSACFAPKVTRGKLWRIRYLKLVFVPIDV